MRDTSGTTVRSSEKRNVVKDAIIKYQEQLLKLQDEQIAVLHKQIACLQLLAAAPCTLH